MGVILADWTIELIRCRKSRSKKNGKSRAQWSESVSQTEGVPCDLCEENKQKISNLRADLNKDETMKTKIKDILGVNSLTDVVDALAARMEESKNIQENIDNLEEENTQLNAHIKEETGKTETIKKDNLSKLEKELKEKENILLDTLKCLETQLSDTKKEVNDLTLKHNELLNKNRSSVSSKLQQDVENLRSQIEGKNEDINQIKGLNNTLILEIEKIKTVNIKLEVEMQKSEELEEVMNLKNKQLHQVLDKYEGLQTSLEIEVAAHLACQQELEKAEWARESFMEGSQEQDRHRKNQQNKKESGHIVDIVQKDRGVAYSFKY